jgi:hypothetical protein
VDRGGRVCGEPLIPHQLIQVTGAPHGRGGIGRKPIARDARSPLRLKPFRTPSCAAREFCCLIGCASVVRAWGIQRQSSHTPSAPPTALTTKRENKAYQPWTISDLRCVYMPRWEITVDVNRRAAEDWQIDGWACDFPRPLPGAVAFMRVGDVAPTPAVLYPDPHALFSRTPVCRKLTR